MLPEILIYPALFLVFFLAVAADGLLIRHLTRDTPGGETTGCPADCEDWDGWGL